MNCRTHFLTKWRHSTVSLACHSILLILTTLISSPLWAVDCSPSIIGLYTQAEVDSFQNTYGPCDRVLSLHIEGGDIVNLDGLAALIDVATGLHIGNNDTLTSISGLSGLTYVGVDLNVQSNENLAQCTGLSDLLDQWDDAQPGPGPGTGGVPDVGGAVLLVGNAVTIIWHEPRTHGTGNSTSDNHRGR